MTIAQPHYNRLFTWTGINGWQVAPEPDPFREPPMPEAQRQARECAEIADKFGTVSEDEQFTDDWCWDNEFLARRQNDAGFGDFGPM